MHRLSDRLMHWQSPFKCLLTPSAYATLTYQGHLKLKSRTTCNSIVACMERYISGA